MFYHFDLFHVDTVVYASNLKTCEAELGPGA